MSDQSQEGLFSGAMMGEMGGDGLMRAVPAHKCAKCGTGYAGAECRQAHIHSVGPTYTRDMQYSFASVGALAADLAEKLFPTPLQGNGMVKVYGIPRGGVYAAYALASLVPQVVLVDKPEHAHIFIDDIIDSGATLQKYASLFPGVPFVALVDKSTPGSELGWVTFPWETNDNSGIDDNIRRILQFVGENPDREGLLETPKRVAKAWQHWTSGYNVDIPGLLKVFEDGAEGYDEMVVRKNIRIYSHCEHHMAPIIGDCTIAYIPNGRVVGLSKLDRLADAFARRLQVQERLTSQIADALMDHLQPKGVGVHISARHMCIESRGVAQHSSDTITSALRGVMKDQPETRAEFMALVK